LKQKQEETLLPSNPSPMLPAENISESAGLSQALMPNLETTTSSPPFANLPLGSSQNENQAQSVISNATTTSPYALPLTTTDRSASTLCSVSSYGSDLIWSSWPPTLPEQPLLLHLYVHRLPSREFRLTTAFRVDVFFKFHPHAHRLFHRQTFLTSLSLPPNHSKFPSAAVLHAISAIGSLYTAAVTSPPRPTFEEFPPGNRMIRPHGNY
jgi:hypothetical protein